MKFKVLFKAPWTGDRWLQWNRGFETLQEAEAAINSREAIDDTAARIVATKVYGCEAWWEAAR